MRPMLTILIFVALMRTGGLAQTVTVMPALPFAIDVDWARFRNDANSGYLEVYYGFYPQSLTYHWQEGKFQAGVKLQTRIINVQKQDTVVSRSSLLRLAEADTSGAWYRYSFVTQAGFVLPHGEYKLEVTATDSLATERFSAWDRTMTISAFPATPGCSDVELCKNIVSSTKQTDLFYKNAMEVVPHPALLYGISTAPVLYYYLELYHLMPAMRYYVTALVVADDGRVARESSKARIFNTAQAAEVGTMNLISLPSGKYTFRMQLRDSTKLALHQSEKSFLIYNPHIQPPAQVAAPASGQQMAGMVEAELDLEFRQARYLATKSEIKFYEALKTVEGKREFLANFWQTMEQGRGDFFPVTRVEYLRRVKIADDRYGALGKDGWQTNRGRIYLLFGEPDEIERRPNVGGKPHEIWTYYSIENGVEFVFVNRFATGDYELVHSTKRGELRDPDWQRFVN